MLVVMIVAGFSATMLCKAMAMVPGNDRFQVSSCGMFAHSDHDLQLVVGDFQGRIELSGLARHYFPKWAYYITLLLLIISLQATNIASIIISSQVPPPHHNSNTLPHHHNTIPHSQTADFALVAIFKWVGGVEIYPDPGWVTADTPGDSNSPFGDVIIISLGFMLVLMTAIPLGYFNLDDNIYVQVGKYSPLSLYGFP